MLAPEPERVSFYLVKDRNAGKTAYKNYFIVFGMSEQIFRSSNAFQAEANPGCLSGS
jgi:hypothetical protein